MNLFAQESKLTRFLNRIGDLIWLNILTIVCCLPIVTIGAAVSAMYEITLKMVKNEEGRIAQTYFRALRQNLRQSTQIWVIGGGVSAFLLFDIWILGKTDYSFVGTYKIVLFVLMLFVLLFTFFILVVQARFENTLRNTIKNGALFCMIHIGRSVLMFLVMLIPVILLCVSARFLSVIVLLGAAGPAYLTSVYFRDLFEKYEK